MAPHHLLALISFLFITIHPSHSSPNPDYIAEIPAKNDSDKVNLFLYYEALCPNCQNFIVNDLVPVFNTDLASIVNLRLVPWGNAQFQDSSTVICQHGDDECYLNTIHACAINIWNDTKKHYNFIRCIESQAFEIQGSQHSKEAEAAWLSCSKKQKLDLKFIQKCYDSGLGKKLLLQNGRETEGLDPEIEFTPWVTVNKKPLLEDYENYADYVCKAYKGKKRAKACEKEPHSNDEEENGINNV